MPRKYEGLAAQLRTLHRAIDAEAPRYMGLAERKDAIGKFFTPGANGGSGGSSGASGGSSGGKTSDDGKAAGGARGGTRKKPSKDSAAGGTKQPQPPKEANGIALLGERGDGDPNFAIPERTIDRLRRFLFGDGHAD